MMFKSRFYTLTICLFCGIGLVLILFISSKYLNSSPGSFIRKIPAHAIEGVNFLALDPSSYYFAGNDEDIIYLGNRGRLNELIGVDLKEKQTKWLTVLAPDSLRVFKDMQLRVDSKCVYLLEGMKSQIWKGDLKDLKITDKTNTPGFIAALTLNNGSLILKSTKKGEGILLKQSNKSDQLKVGKGLLQKQVDGFFCTDGNLVKVPGANKIFYTYYYRNQFICADTNLNLLYRGKTIDTVAHAKIKVASIKSANQITLSAPPVYVNKQSTANEKYLFIHSALKADNETDDMHENGAAIDVYAISDGKYKLSFYLPDFNGRKLTDFRVYGQLLYALYDHYLYKYQLNF